MIDTALKLFFSYAPDLFVGLLSVIALGTWAAYMLLGWSGPKRSFVGFISYFSDDRARAYRYGIPETYIAPDASRLEQCAKRWNRRIERVKKDNADLLTVVFNPNCEKMSDEYAAMWIGIVGDILKNGGLILALVLPLIDAYSDLTDSVKHMIAESARDGKKSITVILAVREEFILHELNSYNEIIASK